MARFQMIPTYGTFYLSLNRQAAYWLSDAALEGQSSYTYTTITLHNITDCMFWWTGGPELNYKVQCVV